MAQWGLTGAPEPKLAGKASLCLVDSQVWAPQVMARWSKGAPAPGPVGAWLRPLNLNCSGSLPGPGGLPGLGPSGYGRLKEGSARPRARWGLVGLLNLNWQGKPPQAPVDSQAWAPQGTGGWRKGAPSPGPGGGPAGAPEAKLAGEASPGLVASQVWAPQVIAGRRKGACTPGPGRGANRAPEAKLAVGDSPGPVDAQA
ncbi:hypothetical protein NDU88_004255 [Pleurodeles waltl]|uniref:Uncharacterized protein n=1 Tax=Pleurodeles waltl TaxID=8319 RepID=A0AAV7W7R2_PLEWA|nr:hypothetical protein NDU88_004255 [Pleurodeles waltl]